MGRKKIDRQRDFFIADIFEGVLKDDMPSMEYPIYSLKSNPNQRPLEYKNDNTGKYITIIPGPEGLATIKDKDVIFYVVSHMMKLKNQGITPPRTIKCSPHDLMKTTNRDTSKRGYEGLMGALRRLHTTTFRTNIETDKITEEEGFHLIDHYKFDRHHDTGRLVRLEITICDWLYQAIENNNVLSIDQEYFELTKAFYRRLYEIAVKHCAKKPQWSIGLDKLMPKLGSGSSPSEARRYLVNASNDDPLPGYSLHFESDMLTFINRERQEAIEYADNARFELGLSTQNEAMKALAAVGLDEKFSQFNDEFFEWLPNAKEKPKVLDHAYTGFIKKKILDHAPSD